MSNKYTLLTFKSICMNFLLELIFFILSHPLTSKQPPKIVQIHMTHPVDLHIVSHFTKVRFASFLSGGFITVIVLVNPMEKQLVKCTFEHLRDSYVHILL